jgi:hypothetical protein
LPDSFSGKPTTPPSHDYPGPSQDRGKLNEFFQIHGENLLASLQAQQMPSSLKQACENPLAKAGWLSDFH